MNYYSLLEQYEGDLSKATKQELESAAKANPNDPASAKATAIEKYANEKLHKRLKKEKDDLERKIGVDTWEKYDGVRRIFVDSYGNGDEVFQLTVIECRNGNFFVETEFIDEHFKNESAISYPFVAKEEFRSPRFFGTETEAVQFAKEVIAKVISEVSSMNNNNRQPKAYGTDN